MKQPIRNTLEVSSKWGISVKVEECIFYEVQGPNMDVANRIVWTRFPFDDTSAGGLPNPCISIDWPTNTGVQTITLAREEVRKAFMEYYRL